MVQVSRNRHKGAICVGSCALYRRKALESNGGTTLIEHSEDVHTGFDLRRAGWSLQYLPIPLATGLCPPDPDSFITQQYRWCAGSMSLLASRKFWTTKMRLRTRCCYLSGFCYYLHTALFTFVTPAIPLTMLIVMPGSLRLINYVAIFPSIVYNLVVFPAWHRCRFGPTAFMAKFLYSWAHMACLFDICRGKRMGWQATGSGKRKAGHPAGVDRDGRMERSHLRCVGATRAMAHAAVRCRELHRDSGHRSVCELYYGAGDPIAA